MRFRMINRLDWVKLLNSKRVSSSPEERTLYEARSPFERDCSRIIFSDAFRRLGRKTQVHPLSKNDHIHTRLTHSQEVAAFGGSLARSLWNHLAVLSGSNIIKDEKLVNHCNKLNKFYKSNFTNIEEDFSRIQTTTEHGNTESRESFYFIVQAACLAHDIGNPPCGHSGEEAIRDWMNSNKHYLDKVEDLQAKNDILNFEGNAQGFRLVSRTEGYSDYGLDLTCSVMGAMLKYPWKSSRTSQDGGYSKKFSYFQSENETIEQLISHLSLFSINDRITRHPLSFLMEAADDACYSIIDLEDAIELNIITKKELDTILTKLEGEIKKLEAKSNYIAELHSSPIQRAISEIQNMKLILNQNSDNSHTEPSLRRRLAKYRSPLMRLLTNDIIQTFIIHYESIMQGNVNDDLISLEESISRVIVSEFKKVAKEKIYTSSRKLELEVGFYSTMNVLLDGFINAANEYCNNGFDKISIRNQKILSIMSHHTKLQPKDTHYTAYLKVLDFISGMTDNYAAYLSKQLNGTF